MMAEDVHMNTGLSDLGESSSEGDEQENPITYSLQYQDECALTVANALRASGLVSRSYCNMNILEADIYS